MRYWKIVLCLWVFGALCGSARNGFAQANNALNEERTPRVHIYTMGAGDDPFSNFGHAAACVHWPNALDARCFNYGTADFSQPLALSWGVLRGDAKFWVSKPRERHMLYTYKREDRSVWRQELPISPEAHTKLAAALHHDGKKENTYFIYNHFYQNCATKLRDRIDEVTGGRLRSATLSKKHPETFRHLVRRGFASSIPLLILSDLFLGRPLDRYPSVWEAMFLPDVLRSSLTEIYHTQPTTSYARQAPLPHVDPNAGWKSVLCFALFLVLLSLLCSRLSSPRLQHLPLTLTALLAGSIGSVLALCALLSPQPEIWNNEALLLLWPTDLLLIRRRSTYLRTYVSIRILSLCILSTLYTLGFFIQPLLPYTACLAAVLLPFWWATRHDVTSVKRERNVLDNPPT